MARFFILLSILFWLGGCSGTTFQGTSSRKSSQGKNDNSGDMENEFDGNGSKGKRDEGNDSGKDGDLNGDSDIDFDDMSEADDEFTAGLDQDGDDAQLQVENDQTTVQLLPVDIKFSRYPDNAAWNNCVRVKVNDQPEVEVGCNKDSLDRVTSFKMKRKPACNLISIRLYSNGNFNFSTENPASVRVEDNAIENLAYLKGFKFFKESADILLGLVNDNGDGNDHTDTTFRLTGMAAISYKIENSGMICK